MASYSVDIVAKALGGSQVDALAKSFQNVDSAAQKAQGGLNNASNGIRNFDRASGGAAGAAKGLGNAILGMLGPLATVTGALALVGKSINTAFERDAAEQKIKNFTSSAGEYQAALALAADSARKFGLSQTEATVAIGDVYSRLKGLGFGLKETGEIYQGFNAIAKQSGTSAEDAAGAFLQLSQALGSGKLQGDELRAILERMPTLAQAIATSMGVSAAEIRKMGEEGKITSTVIYEALSKAAGASGDLNAKLTQQQTVFAALKQVSDRLLNTFGSVFGPLVLKGAEALVWIGERMADWYDYIGTKVFPQIVTALQPLRQAMQDAFAGVDWEYIRTVLQNVLIGGFKLLIPIVGAVAQNIGMVVRLFSALVNNPVTKLFADTFAFVAEKVGLTKDRVGQLKEQQTLANQESLKSLQNYSSIPDKVEDAKAKAKELKAAQEGVTKAIQEAVSAQESLNAIQGAQLDRVISVAAARLQAEQAINGVLLEQAQRQLQAATTDEERIAAAKQVYDLTIRQARLERESELAAIAGAVRKAQLAVEMAAMKEREVASEVALAQAKGIATAEHFKALEAQRQALGLAEIHLKTTVEMAKEQTRAAEAIYKGKVAAADAQLQTNLTAKAASNAASAAGQFAQNMNVAASAANNAADALNRTISQGSGTGGDKTAAFFSQFGAAGGNSWFQQQVKAALDGLHAFRENVSYVKREYASIMNGFHNLAQQYNRGAGAAAAAGAKQDFASTVKQGSSTPSSASNSSVPRYASGGYVTGPQLAVIGEGGESEYVIPASKMGAAMSNYAAGARGNAVLGNAQVNIKTGPVTQMAGTDYVTKQDLISATSSAVNQTLSLLKSDPSTRRAIGVSR